MLNIITAENRAKLGKTLTKYLPVFSGDINPLITRSNAVGDRYVAWLSQDSTNDPEAKEIANSTGSTFKYERVAVGIYMVTTSKNLFNVSTTPNWNVNISNSTFILADYNIITLVLDTNLFAIFTFDSSGVATDSVLGNYTDNVLEVSIY